MKRALSRDKGVAPYDLQEHELLAILARYPAYDEGGGLACPDFALPTVNAALSSAIHDAYSQVQEGARLEALRETLKGATSLCPYCGSPAITDLDHYLPRSKYKDFAIYPRNLVPSCHPCNNLKRAFNPVTDNEHLIQPYFDKMPDAHFLKAEVQISPDGGLTVTYSVDKIAGVQKPLLDRAQFQLDKFELNSRLVASTNTFLANLQAALALAFKAGQGAGVSDFLRETAKNNVAHFGKNDWRVALTLALADTPEFCDGGFQAALGAIKLGSGMA
jgi:hypothetical protein